MTTLIYRLLRKNISIWQIIGYAAACFVGLTIVMSAVRFYGDVSAAISPDDNNSVVTNDYMVISKRVSMLSTIGASSTSFSEADIAELSAQPWVKAVGEFSSANFNVAASVDFHGRGMSTYLFLEAIPDEFIDIKPEGWNTAGTFGPDSEIPVIISKDYLALYNFGFAATRGLPQLSESLISKVPITLYISGNGHTDRFRARIAGFSSRLNTIAVPAAFMDWANSVYGAESTPDAPSRLIVEVSNPGDPAVTDYFESHAYEVAGDKADSGRASYFLTVLTSIVIAIGAVISALALLILMLSMHLLLQKNRDKLRDLMLLGYSPAQVARIYHRLVVYINSAVFILAAAATLGASAIWENRLAHLDLQPSSPLPALAAGLAITILVSACATLSISRSCRRLF